MLVVQVISIGWTKLTRAAPRAIERTRLPRAFRLDDDNNSTYQFYHFTMDEHSSFSPAVSKEDGPSIPEKVRDLRLAANADHSFMLRMIGTAWTGKPYRASAERPRITLLPGQHARIRVNARHTTYYGQYYTEDIYHVAFGIRVAPDRFLNAPDHDVDMRAHLF